MERSAVLIPTPTPDRTVRSALELAGSEIGLLASASGGEASANVVRDPSSPDTFVRKRIGLLRYEDITLDLGLALAKPVYEWVAETWAGKSAPRSGALLSLDQEMQVRRRREFTSGLLWETWIPTVHAASKDPGVIRLTITPQGTRDVIGSGKPSQSPTALARRWMSADFRFEIAGLDTSRVQRVEGFVVRSGPATAPTGKIDFPDLRIWIAAAFADPLRAWFEDFVIKGHNDASGEKTGALVFLAPDRKELGRIALEGLGIRRLATAVAPADASTGLVAVDLYCQHMRFVVT